MKIYYSHPTTREYIGEGMADPDPLEPGNWLIPGGAYVDVPPTAGANQAVIRSESGWVIADDYRGTVYYLGTDQSYTIVNIGELVPAGSTSTPPPPTYKQALDALNLTYQSDVDKLNRSFAIAYLSDGPTQEPKQAAIRSQYEARKAQHAADSAALKVQYGIGV